MVTKVITPQLVSGDGMPHHVRDLCSFCGVLGPVEDENNTTLSDEELYVLITEHEDDHVIGDIEW